MKSQNFMKGCWNIYFQK